MLGKQVIRDFLFLILIGLTVAHLAGCGGGGGGGGGGSGSVESGGSFNMADVTFTGSTAPALITADNANKIASVIWNGGSSSSSSALPMAPLDDPSSSNIPSLFRHWLDQLILEIVPSGLNNERRLSAQSINDSYHGRVSGTMTRVGTVNEDGTGTMTVSYVNFNDGYGISYNGSSILTVHAFDQTNNVVTDMTVSNPLLAIRDPERDVTIKGGMRFQTNLSINSETLTLDIEGRDNRNGDLFRFENFSVTTTFDNYFQPTRFSESFNGRVYVGNEGYVDVVTLSPLQYASIIQDNPDSGGPIQFTGDNGSKAQVIPASTGRARLEVDSDGDGTSETENVYQWNDLSGEPAGNVAPTPGLLTIEPVNPTTIDNLTAVIVSSNDLDGDPLTISYTWKRNGVVIQDQTTSTLQSGLFSWGDVISVTATVSDGKMGVNSNTAVVTIGGAISPTEPLPASVIYNQPVSFQLKVMGVGNNPVTFSLAYGPSNMTVDAATGLVSWTPSGPMFDKSMDVQWGVKASANQSSVVYQGTLTVTNPNGQKPLVRTGFGVPAFEKGLQAGDLDGDGKTEILVTNNRDLIYTLKFDGKDYVQDWVYPFAFDLDYQSRIIIAIHDLNHDGYPEIAVGTDSRIVILDGKSQDIVGEITNGFKVPFSMEIADINNDGIPEIVYLAGDDPYYWGASNKTINVYNSATLELKWQSENLDYGTSLSIGNVDADPALEIVTSKGYVFDGVTYQNQWAYGPGFGFQVKTGDLDNDGIDEIVGAVAGTTVRVYSALLKSSLWDIATIEEIGTIFVANIDNDSQAEIIVGNAQWGNVRAYDGVTKLQQWSIYSQNADVSSITTGDADDDGQIEVIWSSGIGGSGPDALTVAGLNPDIQIEWTNRSIGSSSPFDFLQLDGPFVGGRWLSLDGGIKKAVFASVSTNSGYNGTRLISVDAQTGHVNLTPVVGTNWNKMASLDGADYDGDGVDEVFLTTSELYDAYFAVYDFLNQSTIWTSQKGLGIGQAITHADLNNDGHDDLIVLTTDGYIYCFDIWNQTLLLKIGQLPGTNYFHAGYDISAADLDGDGIPEIIAISTDHLSIYEKYLDTYTLRKLITVVGASVLAVGDIEGDGVQDIVVVGTDQSWYRPPSTVYVYDGFTFSLKANYDVSLYVSDVIIEPRKSGRENLLIAGFFEVAPDNRRNIVSMIDALSGTEIWRSPGLIGYVQRNSMSFADVNDDGHYDLIIGTSDAMYITR
ncbi:MAG: VCBS repeat-containing protein [Candidatus Tectomicrobia bacterium]|uniref:VCBS repeat-containing protein n=1 Tax=Tectimicrobiota bacterium TaxID=2528274 RepID=A0A933GM84_UNCTE|nr:VCBS repeat-containing protein [Candidatus Tectomicrobia bacterium]